MSDMFPEHNNIDAAALTERARVVAWLMASASRYRSLASSLRERSIQSGADANQHTADALGLVAAAIERGEHVGRQVDDG